MSEGQQELHIPRGVLTGAALLIASTIAFTALSQLTGVGRTELGSPPVVASRDLQFVEQADGTILVNEVALQRNVDRLAPRTSNFVRTTLRSMAYERKLKGVDFERHFTLARWADGRLALSDPSTGRRIELAAFGASNAGEFARLLEKGSH